MPKFSRISIIDESRHNPGTLYVAANRYQVDDREPYVFRTRDYGKSWTKIVNGTPSGHFARAVRGGSGARRPSLPGHGARCVRVLRRRRPLAVSTAQSTEHTDSRPGGQGSRRGRRFARPGFWILDDIDPLRQITPEVYQAS